MTNKDNNNDNLLLATAISLAIHLAIIASFLFGFPSFFKRMPEEQVIILEMLPITDVSNVKTQKVQNEKELEEESAKKVQKSKEKVEEQKKPKPEPKKEEVKPEPKKDAVVVERKPEPKKPEPKKQEKPKEKKKSDTDLDSLLKTLEKASEGKEEKSNKQSRSEKTDAEKEARGQFDSDLPLSISEYHALRQQIERHWNVPAGAKGSGEIKITIYISLKIDGSVEKVELKDKQCPIGSDVLCQAAADGALRAVWLASPFQNLSQERYNSWKEFNIEFDPSDILQ